MKEYFLVNKDLRMKGNKGWLEITPKQLQAAAKLKNKSAIVLTDLEDAEKLALENDSNTRFFPIYKIEIADDIEGEEATIELETGERLKGIRFASKDIKVTDAYLKHIPDVPNISLAPIKSKPEDEVNKSPEKSIASTKSKLIMHQLSKYVPSVKTMVKSGLPLALVGAAYYVGASTIAAALATSGFVVPAVLMMDPLFLPLTIGAAACVAVELPELAISLGKTVISGISQVIQVARSHWSKKTTTHSAKVGSDKMAALASHLVEAAVPVVQDETAGKTWLSAFNARTIALKPQTDITTHLTVEQSKVNRSSL